MPAENKNLENQKKKTLIRWPNIIGFLLIITYAIFVFILLAGGKKDWLIYFFVYSFLIILGMVLVLKSSIRELTKIGLLLIMINILIIAMPLILGWTSDRGGLGFLLFDFYVALPLIILGVVLFLKDFSRTQETQKAVIKSKETKEVEIKWWGWTGLSLVIAGVALIKFSPYFGISLIVIGLILFFYNLYLARTMNKRKKMALILLICFLSLILFIFFLLRLI